jgi:hypothetical protein
MYISISVLDCTWRVCSGRAGPGVERRRWRRWWRWWSRRRRWWPELAAAALETAALEIGEVARGQMNGRRRWIR